MATITSNYILTESELNNIDVADGETAVEGDVNDVTDAINIKLGKIQSDMDLVNNQATLAENWATDAQGDDSNIGTGNYSSLAYAREAKGWANAADGAGIPLADGTSEGEESAKTHATNAAYSATAAAASANFIGNWSDATGAHSVPTSVYHNNMFWSLLTDTLDITANEPTSSSSYWAPHPQAVNKNLLLNPNMAINQEGYVSGDTTVSGEHIYDGWRVKTSSSDLFRVITTGDPFGNITLWNNNGANISTLSHINDDILKYPDGTVLTFSCVTTTSTLPVFVEGLGLSSEPIGMIGYHSFTFVKDTADTTDANEPLFKINVTVNAIIDIATMKLEAATVGTAYEPPVFVQEELKCHRYLKTLKGTASSTIATGFAIDGEDALFTIPIDYSMSRVPDVTLSPYADFKVMSTNGGFVVDSYSDTGTNEYNGMLGCSIASALLLGDSPCTLLCTTSSGILKLDARPL